MILSSTKNSTTSLPVWKHCTRQQQNKYHVLRSFVTNHWLSRTLILSTHNYIVTVDLRNPAHNSVRCTQCANIYIIVGTACQICFIVHLVLNRTFYVLLFLLLSLLLLLLLFLLLSFFFCISVAQNVGVSKKEIVQINPNSYQFTTIFTTCMFLWHLTLRQYWNK